MFFSENGLTILKELEGFSLTKYKDANGYSIGYGHFLLPNEKHLTKITKEQAITFLKKDVARFENYVNSLGDFTQNQFDALVVFAYNVGSFGPNFLKHLKARDYSALYPIWQSYNKSAGKVNSTLTKRRQVEIELFKKNNSSSVILLLLIPFLFFLFK